MLKMFMISLIKKDRLPLVCSETLTTTISNSPSQGQYTAPISSLCISQVEEVTGKTNFSPVI